MKQEKSKQLFNEAKRYIVGGVDSPVRSFGAVGGNPLFIESGSGSYITDSDGNSYIDYVCSWGPLILGHRDKDVVNAIRLVLEKRGTSFGAPTDLETELAEIISESEGAAEKIRFVNSGTEATMSAIRVARGVTGRDKIVKFNGCYHGHSDSLLVSAGSGAMTTGVPNSPGVPASLASDTIVLEYNDAEAVEECFKKYGDQIACVIVEPIAANMGLVMPKNGFLKAIRENTEKYGSLFIADEVLVGFRTCYGTAISRMNIAPDIICYGKVIGGGMPVAAYAGKSIYMNKVSPEGPIYQAGTLSGNPLGMAAGIATLKKLKKTNPYNRFEQMSKTLCERLQELAASANIPIDAPHIGSIFAVFFSDKKIENFSDVKNSDKERFIRYFRFMLGHGIYLAPSPFEVSFLSTKHTDEQILRTIKIFNDFLDNEAAEKAPV